MGTTIARRPLCVAIVALAFMTSGQRAVQAQGGGVLSFLDTPNKSGVLRTVTLDGSPIDTTTAFFNRFGTNGRTCFSCHVPLAGWSIVPSEVRERFEATKGLDPIFRTVDGSNSPRADVSTTKARRAAYSMLLNKGVLRIGLPVPLGAEFSLVGVDDPHGYASASELSLFRRPLPTTNLRFLTTVMWDGRESTPLTGTLPIFTPTPASFVPDQLDQIAKNLFSDLQHQSNDATTGHAQAMLPGLTTDVQAAIVNFEMNLATAQLVGRGVGRLDVQGVRGGPEFLAQQPFYVSINDVLGADVFGNPFDQSAMTLFDGWQGARDPRKASVARGAVVFNTFPISIVGVGGLNDALGLPAIAGSCTTCHDTPGVGNHSVALPINIGVSDASRRSDGMPLYTMKNTATGETVQTTDPGRALITGRWSDIGKFKGPILRGLAARAPYFHNGMADDFDDVVDFYETRFNFTLTDQQRADLVAFLKSL